MSSPVGNTSEQLHKASLVSLKACPADGEVPLAPHDASPVYSTGNTSYVHATTYAAEYMLLLLTPGLKCSSVSKCSLALQHN